MNILTTHETCLGFSDGSIMVDAVDGGVPPYLFSLDGGVFDSISVWDMLPPKDYHLVVQDAALCSDTLTAIRIETGLELQIDAGPDIEVTSGDIVPIQIAIDANWSSLLWGASDPIECPVCPLTFLGPVTQEQSVYINVSSVNGCTAIDSFGVYLRNQGNYFVPNIFSPDVDGINDFFFLSGSASTLSIYDMTIFDRWGNLVFDAKEIGINDPAAGWDGYFRGSILNPGVFTFIIKVRIKSRSEVITGNVTLVR
ncbi:MAG: gliding motility-associated C-terminal domain-containing protein [Saprospiraceae bacterium]|nr:gliding motility-associated C-terminal domain-containing protein [Saprospiraceae bacterium]